MLAGTPGSTKRWTGPSSTTWTGCSANSRQLEDLIDLCETRNGAFQLHNVNGEMDLVTSSGRFVARMLVAKAAMESDDLSRRLRRSFDQKAAEGRPHGARAADHPPLLRRQSQPRHLQPPRIADPQSSTHRGIARTPCTRPVKDQPERDSPVLVCSAELGSWGSSARPAGGASGAVLGRLR
jgi:hypothetical protein